MSFVNGPGGAGGQLVERLSFLMDDTGTYKYMGEADPGTATSAATWAISRLTVATGSMLFAAGGAFTQIWDNRASLTYA